MVFINEWLPNPAGADTKNEFVELFNNAAAPVNLGGWILKTSGKKTFSLVGHMIQANGYLILKRTETKLSIKNNGDTLQLYGADGHIVDVSSFLGAAPSGKSFSRILYPGFENGSRGAEDGPQSFAWGNPTPGAANKVDLRNGVSVNTYPFDISLNQAAPGVVEFLGMLIGFAAILAALVVYCLKSHEDLSKLFFPRDGEVR